MHKKHRKNDEKEKYEVKNVIKGLLGINMLTLDEDCDTNPKNSGYSSFAENIENDLKEKPVEAKMQISEERR